MKRELVSVPVMLAAIGVLAAVLALYRSATDSGASDNAHADLLKEIQTLAPDAVGEILPLQGRGPHGEPPVTVESLLSNLTAADRERVVRGKFSAVICMQDLSNDWSMLQVQGIKKVLKASGVSTLAVTDGEFDIDKQHADYVNVVEMRPDVIITIPLDSVKSAPVLKRAAESGIQLVFLDAVPEGFVHPRDYAGVVVADSYANGRAAAELIAERLKGAGKVALFHWQNRMFTCDQRSRAARETFARYPGIHVVAQESFAGAYDVPGLTRQLLRQHPDLDGLWVVWDAPALLATEVILQAGKDVAVATVDLSRELAEAMVKGDTVVGTGAQHPFDQGMAAGSVAVVALSGKKPAPYVAVPGEKVTRSSLPRAWQRVFHRSVPAFPGDAADTMAGERN